MLATKSISFVSKLSETAVLWQCDFQIPARSPSVVLYATVPDDQTEVQHCLPNSFMGDKVTITIESDYVNAVLVVSRLWCNSGSHTLKRGMAKANVILVLALILYIGIVSLLRTSWRVTRTFETLRSIINVATIT